MHRRIPSDIVRKKKKHRKYARKYFKDNHSLNSSCNICDLLINTYYITASDWITSDTLATFWKLRG